MSSLLQKLKGGVAGLFTGGVIDAAGSVADIVERWKPGETTKHQMEMDVSKAINDARSYAAPGADGGFIGKIADGLSRLIRPITTIYVLGVLFGFLEFHIPPDVDPWYLVQGERILVFWFGGKFLLKDIPTAIKYLRKR